MDERAEAISELDGSVVAEVALDPDIHARLVFDNRASLDLYVMPEMTIGAAPWTAVTSGLLGALVGRRVVRTVDARTLSFEFDPAAELRVSLEAPLEESSSYDIAVLHLSARDAPICVWTAGE